MNTRIKLLKIPKAKRGIHIKKSHEGRFTAYCGGNVTSKCIASGKRSPNPKVRKMSTFAANSRRWKHQEGGLLSMSQTGGKTPFELMQERYEKQSKQITDYANNEKKKADLQQQRHEAELQQGSNIGSTISNMFKGAIQYGAFALNEKYLKNRAEKAQQTYDNQLQNLNNITNSVDSQFAEAGLARHSSTISMPTGPTIESVNDDILYTPEQLAQYKVQKTQKNIIKTQPNNIAVNNNQKLSNQKYTTFEKFANWVPSDTQERYLTTTDDYDDDGNPIYHAPDMSVENNLLIQQQKQKENQWPIAKKGKKLIPKGVHKTHGNLSVLDDTKMVDRKTLKLVKHGK